MGLPDSDLHSCMRPSRASASVRLCIHRRELAALPHAPQAAQPQVGMPGHHRSNHTTMGRRRRCCSLMAEICMPTLPARCSAAASLESAQASPMGSSGSGEMRVRGARPRSAAGGLPTSGQVGATRGLGDPFFRLLCFHFSGAISRHTVIIPLSFLRMGNSLQDA